MAGTSPAMTRGGCKGSLPCNRFGFPGQPCRLRGAGIVVLMY
jgi:hypothetical protein